MHESTSAGPLELHDVPIAGPEGLALIAEIQQFYVERYGGEDRAPFTPDEFAAPTGAFWVAVLAGEIVGCAGLRRHDPTTAELKRMFVRAAHRRRGLGQAILLGAERRARELGYRRLILETGHQQPEALALYQAHGYTPTANYGYRHDSTTAQSFIKTL